MSGRRNSWFRQARRDPTGALGADLSVAVAGVVVVFFGWAIAAVGSQYKTGLKIPKLPFIGVPIIYLGLAIVVFGVVLALLNLGVWIIYRKRPSVSGDQDTADLRAPTNDDLLTEMRERGRKGGETDRPR
jgi:hypothetical protein